MSTTVSAVGKGSGERGDARSFGIAGYASAMTPVVYGKCSDAQR